MEEFIKEKIPEFKEVFNLHTAKVSNPEVSKNEKKKTQLCDSSDDENEIEVNWKAVKKEITGYGTEKRHDCAIEFWTKHKVKYPILYEYFITYAIAPASSTPSERLFSRTNYQVRDRRNKISPEKVEKIMFLRL